MKILLRFIGSFAGLSCVVALITGCSSPNDKATSSFFNADTGKHTTGWSSPAVHGTAAKTQSNGFIVCQECHAADYSGGISAISCKSCHGVDAPHAPAPWRGSTWTHTTTNPDNAPVCVRCHANGAHSSLQPSPPAPAGTAPACFNNTLCHASVGHAPGWAAPSQHGVAAKSAPSSTDGFLLCEACHATDFSGGIAQTSCFTCHGGSGPHPTSWITGLYTHTTTYAGNAQVCAGCHTNGAQSPIAPPSPPAPAGTAPGCFNSTLCHDLRGHPAGWSDPSQHGATAEQDFTVCKTCHGATYQGGSATVTCYQCHNGPGLNHPAPGWVVTDHKTAALADMTICKKCHGVDYLGGGSHRACTSCHMEKETKIHRIAWYPDVRLNHAAYAKANGTTACSNNYCHGSGLAGVAQSGPACTTCHVWPLNLSNCATCHATPPAGSVFPNAAGSHAVHMGLNPNIQCATCHNGSGAGTDYHMNGVADVILDPVYNAKTGAGAYSAAAVACSNISCHGGQTTPNWLGGTINVNAQCTSCHTAGTAQYNSYHSGHHSTHVVEEGFACTVCHDTTKLAINHFTSLNTIFTAATASATIKTTLNFNGTTCNPSAGGLTGCHGSHTW